MTSELHRLWHEAMRALAIVAAPVATGIPEALEPVLTPATLEQALELGRAFPMGRDRNMLRLMLTSTAWEPQRVITHLRNLHAYRHLADPDGLPGTVTLIQLSALITALDVPGGGTTDHTAPERRITSLALLTVTAGVFGLGRERRLLRIGDGGYRLHPELEEITRRHTDAPDLIVHFLRERNLSDADLGALEELLAIDTPALGPGAL